MLILTLRTDNPQAELGLFDDDKQLAYQTWQAHRQLAETIHSKIEALLQESSKTWPDIDGIVVYRGPGSFTGLRIGLSVANAIASSLDVPIIGATGDSWVEEGIKVLRTGKTDEIVLPEYGAPVHITPPKK